MLPHTERGNGNDLGASGRLGTGPTRISCAGGGVRNFAVFSQGGCCPAHLHPLGSGDCGATGSLACEFAVRLSLPPTHTS